jgi:peptide/nickel transport system substrate-binding protein
VEQQDDAMVRVGIAPTRRRFLRLAIGTSGLMLLSACAPAAPPTPTAAPAKPVEAPKPVEAAKPAAAPAAPAKPEGLTDATLRIATIGEPPTLDWHLAPVVATYTLAWHVFETLVALDKNFTPKPMLADSWEISPDGLTYTFKLRKGVQFHNGKEMKADDVVASLKRWGELSPNGIGLFQRVKSLEARDDSTVVFQLSTRFSSLLATIGSWVQAAAIMPKDIVESAGKEKVTQFIGTGPYQFGEWRPDVHIKMTRFDGYRPRPEPRDGLAGGKLPIAKELLFIGQTDPSARASSLAAGDVDVAMNLSVDQYATLKSRSEVTTHLLENPIFPYTVFNTKQAPGDNLQFRQGVLAALDSKAIMEPLGPPEFWRLHPALMPKSRWESEAGKEYYNQNNPEKAKQLIQQSGYKGEPLTYMTSRQYDTVDKPAQVIAQQLKAVGVNIDLEVLDWATVISRRSQESGWHLVGSFHLTLSDPLIQPWYSCKFAGSYCSSTITKLVDDFENEVDFNAQYKVWEQAQAEFWKDAAILKTGGDYYPLYAMRSNVSGWNGFIDFMAADVRKA